MDDLKGCLQCDAVYENRTLQEGEAWHCERCHSLIKSRKKDSVHRTLAIALAGILLIYPAMFYPLIGVSAAGLLNDASLVDCIRTLLDSQLYIIAVSLFFFAFAIPIVRLCSAFYICVSLTFFKIKPSHFTFFSSYHYLDNFAMLHVFFLGITVSMYKLLAMAELTVGLGLWSYVMLLICSTLLSVSMDQQQIWDDMEQALESNNA